MNEAYVVEKCTTEYGIWICKRMKKQWHHVCSWRHVWCSSEAAFQCWHFTGLLVENPYLNGKKRSTKNEAWKKAPSSILVPDSYSQATTFSLILWPLVLAVSSMSPKMDFFPLKRMVTSCLPCIENRSISINKLYIFMHFLWKHCTWSFLCYIYMGELIQDPTCQIQTEKLSLAALSSTSRVIWHFWVSTVQFGIRMGSGRKWNSRLVRSVLLITSINKK